MAAGESAGLITAVEPGGPADLAGARTGERLLAINGRTVHDLVDYLSLSADARLTLTLAGTDGVRVTAVHKEEGASLGLTFACAVFDGVRQCRNHCVFCFVDQMQGGLRPSLYIKDEDYRLSFLQGNYVTLGRLTRDDLERILLLRLSPLYVSVHATDPVLRGRLLGLGRPAPILPLLRRLTEGGIRLETQAVICPGWNDRAAVDQTISDLAALWPGVHSLALVPVGLTAHRQGLITLTPFGRDDSSALLRQVGAWQASLLASIGTRFVFAADEFYVQADVLPPPAAHYEDYPQIENGVGLLRSFEDDFRLSWRRWRPRLRPGRLRVATGVAAAGMWQRLARLLRGGGLSLDLVVVANRFLGEGVTVTGLLGGRDIVQALRGLSTCPTFVPRVVLQRGGEDFLDGMSAREFMFETGAEVIDTDATAFLAAVARALADG